MNRSRTIIKSEERTDAENGARASRTRTVGSSVRMPEARINPVNLEGALTGAGYRLTATSRGIFHPCEPDTGF